MNVIAIIIALVIVGLTIAVIAAKKGWLSDRDGDGLPDVIEDKVDDVKDKVEDIVEDVKDAVEDVVDDVKEVIKKPARKKDLVESMGRGGTVNDSFYSIANLADDLEGKNVGKETYPIQVKRLGGTSDGKTNEEIVVRYGEGHKDYFSIYDYKFGEDPTDEDNYDNDYPFSLGIPTGNEDGKQWAAKLGFNVEGMNETTKENVNEEAGFTEVSEKKKLYLERLEHQAQWKKKPIDLDIIKMVLQNLTMK